MQKILVCANEILTTLFLTVCSKWLSDVRVGGWSTASCRVQTVLTGTLKPHARWTLWQTHDKIPLKQHKAAFLCPLLPLPSSIMKLFTSCWMFKDISSDSCFLFLRIQGVRFYLLVHSWAHVGVCCLFLILMQTNMVMWEVCFQQLQWSFRAENVITKHPKSFAVPQIWWFVFSHCHYAYPHGEHA